MDGLYWQNKRVLYEIFNLMILNKHSLLGGDLKEL